jgi:hypothetical protein
VDASAHTSAGYATGKYGAARRLRARDRIRRMLHIPPGTGGFVTGILLSLGIGAASYFTRQEGPFNFDPRGERGTFEPFLAKYLRVAEFIIGLATGSIVLLVGSFALHGQGGQLPWFYASPLLLLALCVIYGVGFMVWLIYHYEEYQHDNQHTRFAYALNLSLGFSSLACFCVGYVWLIFRVTG